MITPLLNRPFERFENLFENWFEDKWLRRAWQPEVDIKETDKEYTLMFDLPGCREEDITVETTDNSLIVSGKREFNKEERKEDYVCIERGHGSFKRTFSLTAPIQTNKITAHMKNGILTVQVPKTETAKPKSIPIHRS